MRQALTDRDLGTVYRLVRRMTGLSQTHLGELLGGVSQPDVSAVERGRRRVTEMSLIERAATGLAMPDRARALIGLAPVGSSESPPGVDSTAGVEFGRGQSSPAPVDVTFAGDERGYELFLRGYGLLATNDRRDIAAAQDLLERAVGRNPRFACAIAAHGYTWWRPYFAGWSSSPQALTNALRDVEAALETDPHSVLAHMTLIRACWDLGWHEKALQIGRSIYDRNRDSLDATVAWARALMNAGLAQCALPLVGSVLQVDATNPAALKLRLWCQLMLGEHAMVMRDADDYLARHPKDANTRWAVALASQNVPGGGPKAIQVAKDAVDADPGDVALWVLLGYLHRLNGEAEPARQAWSRGMQQAGAEPLSNRRRAWIANAAAAAGDRDAAYHTVRELSRAEPGNGYLRYRLGHVLAEIGALSEAVEMLGSAIEHGFLSVQLLRQEELLALSVLRESIPYSAVVQTLAEKVELCRTRYAAHLPTLLAATRYEDRAGAEVGR